jgi:hypothetical protein
MSRLDRGTRMATNDRSGHIALLAGVVTVPALLLYSHRIQWPDEQIDAE